jgi:hypothetical protein
MTIVNYKALQDAQQALIVVRVTSNDPQLNH